MLFNDVISLISVVYDTNDYGNNTETETKKTVYADVQSIRQSEFYQAAMTGLKPEKTFVIRAIDYDNQPTIEHNSKKYTVIRTYTKDNELLELICQAIVGHEVRA